MAHKKTKVTGEQGVHMFNILIFSDFFSNSLIPRLNDRKYVEPN
jgi:hypothetical protein